MDKILKFENFKLNEDGSGAGAAGGTGSGDAAAGGGGTSYANLGNTSGMGAIIAPQPGSGSNGAVSTSPDGTTGSGDRVATPFNSFTKDKKKNKKSKKSDKSKITGKTIDEKSTMYVTRFTDWVNIGK